MVILVVVVGGVVAVVVLVQKEAEARPGGSVEVGLAEGFR